MVTRVTNSMLSNTLMSNLYTNLNKVDTLQNQLASGRKYAHISDDPSALIFGQAARNKLARLSHYQESVGTAQKWLTQAESGVMELQKVVGNIYEELINAGGAKTITDRQNIGMNVEQLKNHYLDTLNASYGDRFVFAAYNTPGDFTSGMPTPPDNRPFTFDATGNLLFNGFNTTQFDGVPAAFLVSKDPADWNAAIADYEAINGAGSFATDFPLSHDYVSDQGPPPVITTLTGLGVVQRMHELMSDLIHLDVGPEISMPVTINGLDVIFFAAEDESGNAVMRNMFTLIDEVHDAIIAVRPGTGLGTGIPPEPMYTTDDLTFLIKRLQDGQNHLLVKTADIGGRDRRLELLEARYGMDEINYENMRSDAEDADIAEVIMNMRMAETVYQAALSAGARVIQPTLMDFLR